MHVRRWMVNQGYKCLLTDMSAPTKATLLTTQGLPPRERQSLAIAKEVVLPYVVWGGDQLGPVHGAWQHQ